MIFKVEVISGLVGILIALAIINDFVGIRKEVKKFNDTNERIVELLEGIKKGLKENESTFKTTFTGIRENAHKH